MAIIIQFFKWLSSAFAGVALKVAGIPAMITGIIAALTTALAAYFGHFTWLDSAITWVHSLSSSDFFQNSSHPVFDILIDFCGLDYFADVAYIVVSATIGAVIAVFITFFIAFLAAITLVYTCRGVSKYLSIYTGGIVKV